MEGVPRLNKYSRSFDRNSRLLPFKSKSQLKFRCSSTIFHPSPGGYQCAVVGPQPAEELFNVRNEFEQKDGRHD